MVNDPAVQMGDVAVDVVDSSSAPPRRTAANPVDARNYSYGADRRCQRKTTDLIPKRVVSYLLVVLALLTGLWLINYASLRTDQWAGQIGQAGMDAFAIHGAGSLATWFTSFLLIMTGIASLQIYALRRHRCDDYRGTYRMWLWIAGLMIIASINCVTNLGTVSANVFQSMTSESFSVRAWVPLALKLIALTALLGRGIYEVRESRGSVALVAFVWVAFCITSVLQFPAIQTSLIGLGSATMIGNCVLFGTAALFLAHLTYARYIFMHAHGLILPRVKKEKAVKVKKKTSQPKAATKKKTKTKAAPKKTATPVAKDSGVSGPVAKKRVKKVRKTKSANTEAKVEPQKSSQQPAKVETPQTAPPTSAKSTSDRLREMAAASRAREQSKIQATNQAPTSSDSEDDGVIKMSKAQRRKQRKIEKQHRRAA